MSKEGVGQKVLGIRVSESLMEEIRASADASDRTTSDEARQLIKLALAVRAGYEGKK